MSSVKDSVSVGGASSGTATPQDSTPGEGGREGERRKLVGGGGGGGGGEGMERKTRRMEGK